jgi:cytochrome c biogenesis protein CcdA
MMVGLDAVLPSTNISSTSRPALILQGIIGLAMLLYAIRAPTATRSVPRTEPSARTFVALVLLGVTVTTMELPTAVPYFGAVAVLTAADLPPPQWLALLILYNAVFVLPPLLLLVGRVAFGRRLAAQYEDLRHRLQAGAREAMLWIFGLIGGALLVWSVIEYVARFG